MKNAGQIVGGALVLTVLLLAGVFVSGPYRATAEIRHCIKAQDSACLQQHVDFPAVRDGLKQQLRAMIAARSAVDSQNSRFAELAGRIALSLVDRMVDSFVTPAGLARLASGATAGASGEAGAPEPFADAEKAWESHDRFVIRVPARNGQDVAFVLTRRGFAWRMTDIRLPSPQQ